MQLHIIKEIWTSLLSIVDFSHLHHSNGVLNMNLLQLY